MARLKDFVDKLGLAPDYLFLEFNLNELCFLFSEFDVFSTPGHVVYYQFLFWSLYLQSRGVLVFQLDFSLDFTFATMLGSVSTIDQALLADFYVSQIWYMVFMCVVIWNFGRSIFGLTDFRGCSCVLSE